MKLIDRLTTPKTSVNAHHPAPKGIRCLVRVTVSSIAGLVPQPEGAPISNLRTYHLRNRELLGEIHLPSLPPAGTLLKVDRGEDESDQTPALVTGQLIMRDGEEEVEILAAPHATWPMHEEHLVELTAELQRRGFRLVPDDRMTTSAPNTQYTTNDLGVSFLPKEREQVEAPQMPVGAGVAQHMRPKLKYPAVAPFGAGFVTHQGGRLVASPTSLSTESIYGQNKQELELLCKSGAFEVKSATPIHKGKPADASAEPSAPTPPAPTASE